MLDVYLRETLFQLFLIFFSIFSIGLVATLFNKFFYKLAKSKTPFICNVTGIIGTPIHELSHAFFCFIFGHTIVEMKLYQPNSNVLGYVNHTYNSKNIYQRIGNFFIGIGPFFFGLSSLFLLMKLLLPDTFSKTILSLQINDSNNMILNIFNNSIDIIKIFFSVKNFIDYKWWIFMILLFCIGLHMKLSKADINGSKIGIIFFTLSIVVINFIFFIINENILLSITHTLELISTFIFSFIILLTTIFSLILIVTFLLGKIFIKKVN